MKYSDLLNEYLVKLIKKEKVNKTYSINFTLEKISLTISIQKVYTKSDDYQVYISGLRDGKSKLIDNNIPYQSPFYHLD
ncbi:hypothetical protein KC669_01010 [Candidatus Dojkabacteria bacterium]|uniref:Uncharacterized protein n=1 Tax=Candidatus Dojkabacteria bacterium TaxID=2099670 RepID=A0A955RL33_9BACT|nr:hypothetical protein [Candidatus Dojkabacteria bacterium]